MDGGPNQVGTQRKDLYVGVLLLPPILVPEIHPT